MNRKTTTAFLLSLLICSIAVAQSFAPLVPSTAPSNPPPANHAPSQITTPSAPAQPAPQRSAPPPASPIAQAQSPSPGANPTPALPPTAPTSAPARIALTVPQGFQLVRA